MTPKPGNVVDLRGHRQETRQQVLERLFREHNAALRAFLRVRMGGSDDLDDIVQDIFVRLSKLESLAERLPAGGETNLSFLFTVANNLLVDMERAKKVRRRYQEEQAEQSRDDERHELTPEASALASEELERVKVVIMGLKPAWREAFILNRFMHKSYREVALEMGVTVKQVEWFVKSAVIRIQQEAADFMEVD